MSFHLRSHSILVRPVRSLCRHSRNNSSQCSSSHLKTPSGVGGDGRVLYHGRTVGVFVLGIFVLGGLACHEARAGTIIAIPKANRPKMNRPKSAREHPQPLASKPDAGSFDRSRMTLPPSAKFIAAASRKHLKE